MTMLMHLNPLFTNRRDANGLRGEFDPLFGALISATPARVASGRFAPATDIHENAEAFVIRLDLPGVPQEDVKITILGDTLAVRGERKVEENREGDPVTYRERLFGTFERNFTLTARVRADQVKATYRDGVLEVRVPKAEEAKVREIEIQVG